MNLLRIQQLPSLVANQIAAGEVIERPASVVKELLENALDAGADMISIEVSFGGLNQLKISDNGAGIIAEDLPLAIAAHATSKISQLSDLSTITSMGFRGEALASIAAVSKLCISSKPAMQEHAMMLRVDGGSVSNITPCARVQGTTIEVIDLFYNAPVRKKFLKTARSEYQAIEIIVKRFALSAPWIALTLKHDGKQIFTLPAAKCEETRASRVKKLLGKVFVENAVHFDVEQSGMRLHGWVSAEDYQRSQNDKQWVYVNQRMVKDKLIHHAIKQAYQDMLHPGRYPACLIYLNIPAVEVDVNVHPTKHEVRFQQPRLVHDFISSNITIALTQNTQKIDPVMSSSVLREISQPEFFSPSAPLQSPLVKEGLWKVQENFTNVPLQKKSTLSVASTNSWLVLNPQFGLIFINEQYYLVDMAQLQQHWLLSRLNQHARPLTSRPLLVPMTYSMNKISCQLFEQYQSLLAPLGIQLDRMSQTEAVVRTIPVLLPQLDIKKFLQHFEETVAATANRIESQQQKLLELLIGCQSFDAHQLNLEELLLLNDYLQQLNITSTFVPWCVKLDSKKCREIIRIPAHV